MQARSVPAGLAFLRVLPASQDNGSAGSRDDVSAEWAATLTWPLVRGRFRGVCCQRSWSYRQQSRLVVIARGDLARLPGAPRREEEPAQGGRERQTWRDLHGHGRSTWAPRRPLPTTRLARNQAGGTSPATACRLPEPPDSNYGLLGGRPARCPGSAEAPLSAASASKNLDSSPARSAKRCRHDLTVRAGTPW